MLHLKCNHHYNSSFIFFWKWSFETNLNRKILNYWGQTLFPYFFNYMNSVFGLNVEESINEFVLLLKCNHHHSSSFIFFLYWSFETNLSRKILNYWGQTLFPYFFNYMNSVFGLKPFHYITLIHTFTVWQFRNSFGEFLD